MTTRFPETHIDPHRMATAKDVVSACFKCTSTAAARRSSDGLGIGRSTEHGAECGEIL